MGYDTHYKFRTLEVGPSEGELIEEVASAEEAFRQECERSDNFEFAFGGDRCTWYDHESDMLEVSKRHSHLVFVLDGNGDEGDDVWRKYFFRGSVLLEQRTQMPKPADQDVLLTALGLKQQTGDGGTEDGN